MSKRLLVCVVLVLFAVSLTLAAPKGAKGTKGSWTGYISDSACAASDKVDKANHPADCVKKCVKEKSAKYVLYDPASKKSFTLDPQSAAQGHEGHHVKVSGTLEGDTIHNAKITMVAEKKKEHPTKKG